jgi:UDP-GlcNAc:undecaprenyl-phosphate GlcNAc-1-phosphate transferase
MIFNEIYYNLVINEIIVSLAGFFSTLLLIPLIVSLAWKYNLVYLPNHRTSHVKPIPAIGGIAVFFGFLISGVMLAGFHTGDFYIIAGGIVSIFFIGVIDDIFTISAVRKLIFVVAVAIVISTIGGIRLTSLHHFLGVNILPSWMSVTITVLLITYIINAVNLIDGIDGLAAITGIFSLIVFDVLFLRLGYSQIISVTIPFVLAYAAFLIYNLWGKRFKIFMGDTGSLILGFVIAVTVIKFCNLNAGPVYHSRLYSPLTVVSILIVPLFDQLHVFVKRILSGKSPFHADRSHLHHTWLKLGFSHRVSSLILLGYGIFFFMINTFILIHFPKAIHILSLLIMALIFWHAPEQYLKRNPRKFVVRRNNYKKKQMRGSEVITKRPSFLPLPDIHI